MIRVIIKQYKFCEISCHDLSHVWYIGEVGFAVNSFILDNSINNVGEGPDVWMFDRRGAPWNQFEVIDGGRLGHLSTWLTEYVVDLVRMSFWRFHYPRRSVKACLPACLLACLLAWPFTCQQQWAEWKQKQSKRRFRVGTRRIPKYERARMTVSSVSSCNRHG